MVMELKIWYDGISRTVSGVSEDTTCQEVVIALVQAVGQSGRFVLKEKSGDVERFLAPTDYPVRAFATRGLYSNNVQFILCRTDQKSNDPEPIKDDPEMGGKKRPPSRRSTFRDGTPSFMSAPKNRSEMISISEEGNANNNAHSQPPRRNPPRGRASLIDFEFSYNEWMDLISMQQARLDEQQAEMGTLDDTISTTETSDPEVIAMATADESDRASIVSDLERVVMRNDVDLHEFEFWEDELRLEETETSKVTSEIEELREKLSTLDNELCEHKKNVQSLSDQALLEKRRLKTDPPPTTPSAAASVDPEAVRRLTTELDSKKKENAEHKKQLTRLETEIRTVEKDLGGKTSRLEDLGKEIRQANLQEFIRQTTPPPDLPLSGNCVKNIITLKTGADSNTNSLPRSSRNVLSLLKNISGKQGHYTISTTDMPDGVWV